MEDPPISVTQYPGFLHAEIGTVTVLLVFKGSCRPCGMLPYLVRVQYAPFLKEYFLSFGPLSSAQSPENDGFC